jgi:thiamine monophosphate kinase
MSIRPNTAGSIAITYKPTNPAAVEVGATLDTNTVAFTPAVDYVWAVSTSYVIRVVTSTGFYYELVATTPSSIPAS